MNGSPIFAYITEAYVMNGPASLPNGLNERARMVTSTITKEVRRVRQ
jgi:hypothetical protein